MEFGNTRELGRYLFERRSQKFNTVARVEKSVSGDTRDSSLYNAMCKIERGEFPEREMDKLTTYLGAIGVDESEQKEILDMLPRLLFQNIQERAAKRGEDVRGKPTKIDYNGVHGRPAKYLAKQIEENTKNSFLGGMTIGEDLDGRDWIRDSMMLHNANGEMSLDEVIYLANTVAALYKNQVEKIEWSTERLKDQDPSKSFHGIGFGVFSLDDALRDKPKTHMLKQVDNTAAALDTKLKMFELQGYCSAEIMRSLLNEAMNTYLAKVEESFAIAHEMAVKHVEGEKVGGSGV